MKEKTVNEIVDSVINGQIETQTLKFDEIMNEILGINKV
jgi:hypothetical protein